MEAAPATQASGALFERGAVAHRDSEGNTVAAPRAGGVAAGEPGRSRGGIEPTADRAQRAGGTYIDHPGPRRFALDVLYRCPTEPTLGRAGGGAQVRRGTAR